MKNNVVIIGIAGGSGSGKTRLVKNILSELSNTQTIAIEVDSYYKDLSHIPFKDREKHNFDHPNSIDFELLHQNLIEILNNKKIKTPVYNYKEHIREKNKSKKVAAIGLKIKRWIVYHGFSINISNNLDKYKAIIPCGVRNKGITNLKKIKDQNYKELKKILIRNFILNLQN